MQLINKMKTQFYKLYQILSVALLFLAASFSLLTIAAKHTANSTLQILSVVSGSMQPEIPIGSGVAILKQPNYYINDIITYTLTNRSVTHRIVYAGKYFLTKGDANNQIDTQSITQDQILGKVILTIPYLGYLQESTKTMSGILLYSIIPTMLIVLHELLITYRHLKHIDKK